MQQSSEKRGQTQNPAWYYQWGSSNQTGCIENLLKNTTVYVALSSFKVYQPNLPRAFLLGHISRRIGGGNAAARLWARDSTLALREKAKGWQGHIVYVSAIFAHFCLFLLGQYHWFWRREFNTLCQFRQIQFEGHRSQCFCFFGPKLL